MVTFLVILVLVLAAIAVAKLAQVYEHTSELQGKREEEIAEKDHKFNANLMLAFFFFLMGFFIWQIVTYGPSMLPEAASEHGQDLDTLLNFNWAIVITVFVFTQALLFFFSYKYYYRKDRKAKWYPHNNKLELLWTTVPAVFMAVIIIYGLNVWNDAMDMGDEALEDPIVVELYSKQFDWTARYPGADGELGKADFNLISAENPLGIYTPENVEAQVASIKAEIMKVEDRIANEVLPDNTLGELEDKRDRLNNHLKRTENLRNLSMQDGTDDIQIKGEFHLPVGKQVLFYFRSQDVIHSAYMPHFRAQMNTVPGLETKFKFKPIITTAEMREKLGDEEFNYVLLCNKVCGAAHFNMKMDIIVESEEEYNKWYEAQLAKAAGEEAPADDSEATEEGADEAPAVDPVAEAQVEGNDNE